MISETPLAAAPDTVSPDLGRLAQVTAQATTPAAMVGPLLPPRAQAAGTLRRLYETALLLFGQHGFHAVSVRDLTR
ncbi:MAG TPA: hypothetical protein VFT62_07260, partial [Mycobacteriales bacterium]|nr:hypothetical protein [Mycobacteriales bacterium]